MKIKEINENSVTLRVPDNPTIYEGDVFFNPRMERNRDLSVLFTKVILEEHKDKLIKFYEPLAGTGVRGLRLLKELGTDQLEVLVNDISENAIWFARENAKRNHITRGLLITQEDAVKQAFRLHESWGRPFIVDLDPYGSPIPFMDALTQVLSKEGYMFVTATDLPPLCGVYKETCYRKYQSVPLRNYFCHETAIRILLASLASSLARRSRGMHPLAVYYHEHFIKVFVKTVTGKERAKKTMNHVNYGWWCQSCDQRGVISKFELGKGVKHNCKSSQKGSIKIFGPLWTGALGDKDFLEKALKLLPSLSFKLKNQHEKYLTKLIQESSFKPFYYKLDVLCKQAKINVPKTDEVLITLRKKGINASPTIFDGTGVKTDIEPDALIETIREINRNRALN